MTIIDRHTPTPIIVKTIHDGAHTVMAWQERVYTMDLHEKDIIILDNKVVEVTNHELHVRQVEMIVDNHLPVVLDRMKRVTRLYAEPQPERS
jgi:hypothetical protein